MNYKELMNQPNGVLFYEEDITAPAIFQKVATIENIDIIIRSFDKDFEQCRFGLSELDSIERDSKNFHVYSKDELNIMNEFFTLAYLTE